MQPLIHKVVNELKANISDKYELQEMRVFGSSARGDRRADSDIDVFVHLSQVNRQIEENLFDMAYDLELKYDCLIDLIVFGDEAVKERYARTPIYQKIFTEGTAV
ncbi:MAG: nucleotidyltransferase domain-containing protein [bacterium]